MGFTYMKSIKEVSLESKILKRLENLPDCTKLVNYLFADEELQEMQDYANNVSIKRLGYNDHGPVHMRQVVSNAIKMLNLLKDSQIKTSLETEDIGTFEDSMCAVILSGLMHDLGMMIGRQGHEDMSVILAKPLIERALMQHDIKLSSLQVLMYLGSTESIKLFLENSDCMGIVSVRSISKELAAGIFRVIEIKDMPMMRALNFVGLQGQEGGLAQVFMQFAEHF